MAKFKIGDKVKLKEGYTRNGRDAYISWCSKEYEEEYSGVKEFYIFENSEIPYITFDNKTQHGVVDEVELELVLVDEDTKETNTPKFKVGDRVKIVRHIEENNLLKKEIGHCFTVERVSVSGLAQIKTWYYEVIDGITYYTSEFEIELEEQPLTPYLPTEQINLIDNGRPRNITWNSVYTGEACVMPINNNIKTKMTNLINKFKEITRSEPSKTFVKTGILDNDLNLTQQGTDLFIKWMFDKHADEFKSVADQLVEDKDTK